ncbi:MAG: septum formation initiator family protein [Candidatus Kerfeldbacteria bacterium]|nr:septum formation initiator family protein [Candidatus Kerfeldbacteria bacterium]
MRRSRWQPPDRPTLSWWMVVVSGSLVVLFTVAIIRESARSDQVRQQVQRLRQQVTDEERRQEQLAELITYLRSQTYQEREARLKLGLRKSGERVIVVPPGTVNVDAEKTNGLPTTPRGSRSPVSTARLWWQYFFGRSPSVPNSSSST